MLIQIGSVPDPNLEMGVGGDVFFSLGYFDFSDLQLFAIFIFKVDFSETYLMTSAENRVSDPPNLKLFWGRIPQTPLQGSCLRHSLKKKPSYGHESCCFANPRPRFHGWSEQIFERTITCTNPPFIYTGPAKPFSFSNRK